MLPSENRFKIIPLMYCLSHRHFKGLKLLPPQKSMDIVGLEKSKIKEYIDTHVSPENKTRVQNAIFTNPIMLSVSTITFFCMMLCRALEDADGSISIDQDLHTYTRITSFIFKVYIFIQDDQNVCVSIGVIICNALDILLIEQYSGINE